MTARRAAALPRPLSAKPAAVRMRRMRRLRRAGLIPLELHLSRQKLRLITAAREALPDDVVARMSDQQLLASMRRGFAIHARIWLRRYYQARREEELRVTPKASSAAG
jgi:hypothetical protein